MNASSADFVFVVPWARYARPANFRACRSAAPRVRVKLETPSRRALIFRYEHAFVGGDVIPLELVAGIVAGIVRRWANRAGMAQTPWGIPVLVGEARVLGYFLAGRRRIAQAAAGIPDIAGQAWVLTVSLDDDHGVPILQRGCRWAGRPNRGVARVGVHSQCDDVLMGARHPAQVLAGLRGAAL